MVNGKCTDATVYDYKNVKLMSINHNVTMKHMS